MHAIHLLDPRRQRGLGHRLAGSDVFLDPLRDLSPAGGLPDLERPHAPAEAPANGQVNIAGGIGNFGQQHRRIVEHVALNRPQELGFWMVAGAQRGKFFSRVLDLEDRLHRRIRLGAGILVSARDRIEHLLALAGVNAGLGLLAQRALGDQRLQPGGRDEVLPPRILFQRQRRTLDHVAQGVQPDHVSGAEGGALGPTDGRAGQRIHQVQPQPERLGVVHGGGHREHADAVGDEVGGVLGADHALAQRADQEGFQQVQNGWIGGLTGNHFHQRHVARRVEEVDAAEPGAHVFGHRLGQHTQRQAGGIGGQNRPVVEIGRNLLIQVGFPVWTLGDGLDQQIAAPQFLQVLVIVGGLDQFGPFLGRKRGRAELDHARNGLGHDPVGITFLGR